MKTLTCFLILLLVQLSIQKHLKKLPITPKADDLNNHFGKDPLKNEESLKATYGGLDLERSDSKKGDKVSEISNYNKEILSNKITSGALSNVSSDSTKIVNPELTFPKVIIQTELVHNAVVKTPVQIGVEIEKNNTSTLNRETKEVLVEKVTIEKPILAVLETVKEVVTPTEAVVDLTTNKIVENKQEKKKVGIEEIKK